MSTAKPQLKPDYPDHLQQFQTRLRELFEEFDREKLKDDQETTLDFLDKLRETEPLSVLFPEDYGGRGHSTADFLSLLEITSYESLPFSLLFGINGALFIQPVLKYGSDVIKEKVLKPFTSEKLLGGLMISEPEHGTDALHMETSFTNNEGSYEISGTKHWGGLTGMADHWVVAARGRKKNGDLGRDISLFVCDQEDIEVDTYYHNLGLHELPYGKNLIQSTVSEDRKLNANISGMRLMQDLLHKSRLEFPGMAAGYLRRIRDEAHDQARGRKVSGSTLDGYENVKRYLSFFDAACSISAAMCRYTAENVTLEKDLSGKLIMANSIKAYVTDLMQRAADTYLQLSGANGYRRDHLSGQSYVDTRSFQIFEGPNDVLYSQIGDKVLNTMEKQSITALDDFVEYYEPLDNVPEDLNADLHHDVNSELVQNERMVLGQLVAELISLSLVGTLKARGLSSDKYHRARTVLEESIRIRLFQLENREESTSIPGDPVTGHEWRNHLT
ncbi:MAG: acyl-CoA dehydrogenase family protein [bacterium]